MNLIEITEKFPDELDAIKYFERRRWKNGKPICPYCESINISKRTKDFRFKCYDCTRTFSVTVNTNIHGTGVELKKWMFAFSIVADAKKGLSALQLHRNLDISYPTAFKMYHRIRELMAVENEITQEKELSGIVEMDEVYIGGKPRKFNHPCMPVKKRKELDKQISELKDKEFNFKPNKNSKAKCKENPKRGRGTDNIPVVGIVQRNGNVVAEVMRTLSYDNLKKMVKKYVVENESVLITDSYSGYNSMKKIIDHIKIDHQKLYSYKGVNSNSIESFWAIIERGIIGQYHSVSAKMLPNYIAEFVFKFNNRNNDNDMFETLVKISMKEAA